MSVLLFFFSICGIFSIFSITDENTVGEQVAWFTIVLLHLPILVLFLIAIG